MLTTLSLRRTSAPVREPVAWLLPGDDAAAWLGEVAQWPVATEQVGFYLMAETGGDGAAAALVTLPAGVRPPPGSRVQPYGLGAPGIYLPVDAELWPPVRPEEVRAATAFPVLIFHPALGLTGCDDSDRLGPWDLLGTPPRQTGVNWSAARSGPLPAPGLGSVHVAVELSLEGLFGSESEDIASASPEVLPPSPGEAGTGIGARLAQGVGGALAAGLLGLAALVPRTAGGRVTWINALENWAMQKRQGLTEEMERERHRELHRLLDLLASNPEEGLRHAIPLAALLNRGLANASSRLGPRSTDFNLRRLEGGRPADRWDVPDKLRTSLATSYREMAMREMGLGRHRRAARILAELLGDFATAADALKQGRFFREAALLYREHLRNPTAAAGCFADGGMIAEALALYEQHALWLEAADLHARLGDREAEYAAIRRVVAARQAAGDTVAAARLIETRLQAPDEALALLAATWPDGKDALVCLEERFDLLERHRRSTEMSHLLGALAAETTPLSSLAPLCNIVAKVFERGTDAAVRSRAADAVRVKAAAGLAQRRLERPEELAVLRSLARLAPEDRLLARDVVRFREQRPKATFPPPLPPVAAGFVRRITPEKIEDYSFRLAEGWIQVSADADFFYGISLSKQHGIVFSRGNWKHGVQSAHWVDPATLPASALVFTTLSASVIVARPMGVPLELKTLPATDGFKGLPCTVGTPAWLPSDTVNASASRFGVWAVRAVGDRVVLAFFNQEKLVDSRDVTDDLVAAGADISGARLSLEARGGHGAVALAYGSHLLIHGGSSAPNLRVLTLDEPIRGLIPVSGIASGWIVLQDHGATFVSADLKVVSRFIDDLELPRGAFLGDDLAVLIGGQAGWIVRLQPSGPVRLACFSHSDGAGIAVTTATAPREFAVFQADGSVRRWKFAV